MTERARVPGRIPVNHRYALPRPRPAYLYRRRPAGWTICILDMQPGTSCASRARVRNCCLLMFKIMELMRKQLHIILIAAYCFVGTQGTGISVIACPHGTDGSIIICIHTDQLLIATVSTSPSGVATVCSGDQLELTCNITGRILDWSFFMIDDETGAARKYAMRGITADAQRESQTFTLTRFNSTVITFLRLSTQDSPVLTSRVFISPVSDSLDGTVVTCMDVASQTMESITIITFISQSQGKT